MITQDKKLVMGHITITVVRMWKLCLLGSQLVEELNLDLTVTLYCHLLVQSSEIFFGSKDYVFSSQSMCLVGSQRSSRRSIMTSVISCIKRFHQ